MAIRVTTTELQDPAVGGTDEDDVWLPGCLVHEYRRSDWEDRATFCREFQQKYPAHTHILTREPGHKKTTVYTFQCEESYQEFLAFEKFDEPETLEILRQCHRTATRVTEII